MKTFEELTEIINNKDSKICYYCKHWKAIDPSVKYPAYDHGKCGGLIYGDQEIYVQCYGDGGVDWIETDSTFGCTNFENKI